MEIVIALFFLALILLVILPTLPHSRRLRVILAILAIPGIIFAYRVLEMYASTGAQSARLDEFIKKCDNLLNQGKTEEVRAILADYMQKRGKHNPESSALASRAHLLYHLIKEKELEIELAKLSEK
ncbi:hypothetical protein [Prosthecobacter fluviatilis]|uniref:Uncharacterized protein n=1 Tax=Prosthecobacter fluviatilis TaxID=445931 RepID=A0ABW0KND6_9BACT